MGIVWASGAELGDLSEQDYGGANLVVATDQKRTGGYSYKADNNAGGTGYLVKGLAANSELYIQFAIRFSAISDNANFFMWYSGGTVLGCLRMDSSGHIRSYTGDANSLKATGTKILAANTWYVVEVHIKIADSGGIIDVRVNGLSDSTFSGDSKPGSETTIDVIKWNATAYNQNIYVDDIVVNDTTGATNNSWPDGLKIALLAPSGAGTTTQWTPSTGNNYACVDEIPPVDTDYVSINTVDQIDLYALGDFSGTAAIAAFMVTARAAKQGATACPNLKLGMRISGANYWSANKALPTVQTSIPAIFEVSPATSVAFTVAEINGLEIGIQSAA